MKKMLIAILVSVAAATAVSGTETAIQYSSNFNSVSENVLFTATAVTVFEIQNGTGPAYVLCLENAAQRPAEKIKSDTYASVINLLPEPVTIALLGLSGFLMRRRKTT
jgi:hypothetical protein